MMKAILALTANGCKARRSVKAILCNWLVRVVDSNPTAQHTTHADWLFDQTHRGRGLEQRRELNLEWLQSDEPGDE